MIAWRLGKIPTVSVRRRISRLRRSLGLLDQIWVHTPVGEGREREDVCPGLIEVITHGGELVVDVVQEPVVLRVDRCGVGLVVHRVQHRFDSGP